MRLIALLLLASLSAAALGQEADCRRGAELTLELEAARAELGDEHADVIAIAVEIRALQEALLEAYPDRTIEDICNVPAEPVAAQPDGPDPNEVICRREQVVGSHRRREVCMTRAEREAMGRETQERLREQRGLNP